MEGDLAEEEESRRTRDEERAIREGEALEKRANSTSKSPKPKVSSEVRQRATSRSVSFFLGECPSVNERTREQSEDDPANERGRERANER